VKCDLCKHQKSNNGLLCETCGATIKRLLAVQERLESPSTCAAARLSELAKAACAACGEGAGARESLSDR
jgi:hypothetical protein